MKRIYSAALAGVFLAAGINAAHADFSDCISLTSDWYAKTHPIECFFADVTLSPMTTSLVTSMADFKEEYVNEVRDEAADYVAEDGSAVAGAALNEVLQKIRSEDPDTVKLSDLQIARRILGLDSSAQ